MVEIDIDDTIFIGDKILHEYYDCLDCGICCNFFNEISLYRTEINTIATHLSLDEKTFLKKYMKIEHDKETTKELSLKTPCPFNKNKKCVIYPIRGLICRLYPLMINFSKNIAVLSGIYLCPQATQFYEGLLEFNKKEKPLIYKKLLELEEKLVLESDGMKLKCLPSIISPYLDWISSDNK